MGRLDEITLEELQELLDQVEEGKPRERVIAAIGRKQGDEIETLAERHGVVEKTIRNWLDRFEQEPIEQALHDDTSPGRPPKLDTDDRDRLFEQLQHSPTELGYEQQAWSPKLLLAHVKDEYGVEYSKGHARKLLGKAELSCRTARPRNHEADPEKKAEFQATVEKNGRS
jgi:transposase